MSFTALILSSGNRQIPLTTRISRSGSSDHVCGLNSFCLLVVTVLGGTAVGSWQNNSAYFSYGPYRRNNPKRNGETGKNSCLAGKKN